MRQYCKDCVYYRAARDSVGQAQSFGHCHGNAPVVMLMPVPVKQQAVASGKMVGNQIVSEAEQQVVMQPTSFRPAVQGGDYACRFYRTENTA